MLVRVGSINPTKVAAVEEYFFDADLSFASWLKGGEIVSTSAGEKVEIEAVEVDSGVSEQPNSLAITVDGANNRACAVKGDADLGIGIESGIEMVAYTGSGWMNFVVCSIYDGSADFKIGIGSGFEIPRGAIEVWMRDHVDLSEAFYRGEYTTEKRIGYGKGLIHVLTNGALDRKQYIKQAIEMAMVQLKHPKWYGRLRHRGEDDYALPS